MLEVNQANSNLVASGFLNNLANKVEAAMAPAHGFEDTLGNLVFTNYQALTGDIVLAIATQALEDVSTEKSLPASSSLIFEVNADNTIRGYLNDVEMVPSGCKADKTETSKACNTAVFISSIREKVMNQGSFPEMADACNTSELDLQIEIWKTIEFSKKEQTSDIIWLITLSQIIKIFLNL